MHVRPEIIPSFRDFGTTFVAAVRTMLVAAEQLSRAHGLNDPPLASDRCVRTGTGSRRLRG